MSELDPPAVWWSLTWHAIIEQLCDGRYEVLGEPAVPLAELPADAVRLVPDTVQTPPLSFRPGDSVAANIIADALTRATGWLPLSVRYRAAQVALETAHQWHEVKPAPDR